jgi:glycosyltransferase involved in cell wall biosynthesis
MAPAVSVVVVTWNRRKELEAALESVFRQTMAKELEVIVVDNASTDDTVKWLAEEYAHPVRLHVFERNMGASHGRNAGIRLSRAPLICFLDSDAVILSDNAIERCVEELRAHPKKRAVSALIWRDRERTIPFCKGCYITPEGHYSGPRTRTETEDPHFLSTCFAVWDKVLLEELRGFDPWYFWGIEDLDISLRAYHAALRGETVGASRFAVLEDVHILHEMARTGRHYQYDDFLRAFHAIERQRMHLVLAYGGVGEFFRVLFTAPLRLRRIEGEAWEQRLGWKLRAWGLVLYPLWRVVKLPVDLPALRSNFLEDAPLPREVVTKASASS